MTLSLGCLMPLLGGSINSWQRCGHMMVTTWTSRWCLMDMRYVPDERLPQINPWAYVPLFSRFRVEEEYLLGTRKLAVATPKVQTTLNLRAIWLCKLTYSSESIKLFWFCLRRTMFFVSIKYTCLSLYTRVIVIKSVMIEQFYLCKCRKLFNYVWVWYLIGFNISFGSSFQLTETAKIQFVLQNG